MNYRPAASQAAALCAVAGIVPAAAQEVIPEPGAASDKAGDETFERVNSTQPRRVFRRLDAIA